MSILNKVFRNEKVLINIFSAILFVFGILFGIIYYFYGNEALLNLCKYIFFFKDNGGVQTALHHCQTSSR